MQITNYGFLESRGNFLAAEAKYSRPAERLSTGLKINHSHDDAGELGKAALQRLASAKTTTLRSNLQNALSYVQAQDSALSQVGKIYDRIGFLAQQATDLTINDHTRSVLDAEFQSLEGQLAEILKEKFNGVSLFTKATGCSEPEVTEIDANFDAGLDETQPPAVTGSPNIWRATQDVDTTDGTLTLDVNGGGVAERYIVKQGTTEIFDTNWWATEGSAYTHDFDRFVIDFGAGKPTTFEFVPRDTGRAGSFVNPNGVFDNRGDYLAQLGVASESDFIDPATGGNKKFTNQGQVVTNPAPGDSTELTVEIQSTSLFQASASFKGIKVIEPEEVPALEVVVNEEGEIARFEPLGFSRLSGLDLSSRENAEAVLKRLLGENGEGTVHGEIHCLINGQRADAASSIRRLELELGRLEDKAITGENSLGRIVDADMAEEATQFAKNSLKMDLAANIMSNSTRLMDVLLPLATQRYSN